MVIAWRTRGHLGAAAAAAASLNLALLHSASAWVVAGNTGEIRGRKRKRTTWRLCVRERRSILGKGAGNEWLLLACICKYTDTLPRAHTARDSSSQCVTLRQQPPPPPKSFILFIRALWFHVLSSTFQPCPYVSVSTMPCCSLVRSGGHTDIPTHRHRHTYTGTNPVISVSGLGHF